MIHARMRHILPLLIKKLKYARVLSIQGARQTGKSFLARELLPQHFKKIKYETFDQLKTRSFAKKNPESFLNKNKSAFPFVVDEAQKVPDIFDAIKYEVDIRPRPGRFILLGSSEFSREAKIRESLTGRLSRTRLYPMNISETQSLSLNPSKHELLLNKNSRVSREVLMRYLGRGGFPGIFSVRNDPERENLIKDWLDIVLNRDLLLFSQLNPNPDLAYEVLEQIALIRDTESIAVAKNLGAHPTEVLKNIKLLENLFVLHKLLPHASGCGKPRYFICDVGLASFLGANFSKQLCTWFLLEQLSQRSYKSLFKPRLYYYRSSRGGIIDLVVEPTPHKLLAIKILSTESYDLRDFEILKAFKRKNEKQNKVDLFALSPVQTQEDIDGIKIYPWEAVV